MSNKEKTLDIQGRKVVLSKPGKEIFPGDGITKADIVDYYRRIWPHASRHASGRPMVLQRFPDGITEEGFYQKKTPDYFPGWIETIGVKLKENGTVDPYVNCNSEATIAYLANQGCITLHLWLSKKENLNKPDRMIFDLDPPKGDFEMVRKAAFAIHSLFDEAGIHAYPMVTGSKGMHVVIPIKPTEAFDEVRKFARKVAEKVAASEPEHFTTETSKDKRKGRVFIDYLRNSYGQTAVMPYSLRAIKDAPVAVPLSWDEAKNHSLDPQKYTMHNIFRRMARKKDPWRNMHKNAVPLKEIRSLL